MIRISQSEMHWGPLLCFFRGDTLLKGEQYLFAETKALFGAENLAQNIVEIAGDETLLDIQEDIRLRSIFRKLWDIFRNRKIVIAEFTMTDSADYDYQICYTDGLPASLRDYPDGLFEDSHGGFRVAHRNIGVPALVYTTNFSEYQMEYYRVEVSRSFLAGASTALSPRLHDKFNAQRYVDAQAAMMLLGAKIQSWSDRENVPFPPESKAAILSMLEVELGPERVDRSILEQWAETAAQMIANGESRTDVMATFAQTMESHLPDSDTMKRYHVGDRLNDVGRKK